MTTDFTPTHRTNRAIGNIKSGSLIRVAKYNDPGYFIYPLRRLGAASEHIEFRYQGEDVQFWDSRVRTGSSRYVFPDDYVITDGDHFEVSNTDSGWDLLPTEPRTPEGVSLDAWSNNMYTLRGDTGAEINLAASQLHDLVQLIQNTVPEPSPIEGARFISARTLDHGEFRTLAKIDGIWYDHNGDDYMDIELLANYDEIEVIR